MTKKEMIYVQTIAKEGNLSKAADSLYMTQPSLSHALKKIESELNVQLFKRTNRGLILTFEGERYLSVTSTMLKLYEDFQNEMNDVNILKSGKIHIGVTVYIGSNMLPDLIKNFKSIAPNVIIDFTELTSVEQEEQLRQGTIDFSLMHKIIRDESMSSDGITYTKIIESPFVIVVEKDNPLKKYSDYRDGYKLPFLDPKHLDNIPFIFGKKYMRSRRVSDSIMKQAGIEASSYMETKNFITAKNLVARGLGVSILPKDYLGTPIELSDVDLYNIDPIYLPYWDICLATPSNGYISKSGQVFIDTIKNYFIQKNE